MIVFPIKKIFNIKINSLSYYNQCKVLATSQIPINMNLIYYLTRVKRKLTIDFLEIKFDIEQNCLKLIKN